MNTTHPTTDTRITRWQQQTQPLVDHQFTTRQLIFIGAVILCLTPVMSPRWLCCQDVDTESQVAVDNNMVLVKGQCTVCQFTKLILQSHFDREK